jgi:hypothetical protein
MGWALRVCAGTVMSTRSTRSSTRSSTYLQLVKCNSRGKLPGAQKAFTRSKTPLTRSKKRLQPYNRLLAKSPRVLLARFEARRTAASKTSCSPHNLGAILRTCSSAPKSETPCIPQKANRPWHDPAAW